MLKKRDNRTDLEILLEVFKKNGVEWQPIEPTYPGEVIDYCEIINEDGTTTRLYGNPDELLLDYSYYFGNKKGK